MLRFANPTWFLNLARRLIPWVGALSAILIVWGLYGAFFEAPADYQQGETVRIMYVHVPAAWMALFVYTVMALASVTLDERCRKLRRVSFCAWPWSWSCAWSW